jgi:predicted MFS family arabinose efflux permease
MAVEDLDAESTRAGSRAWVGVCTIGVAVFTLVTSELYPVGVLSAVSADLEVPTGVAGLMVTVPGLVAAVSAPLVAVYARGLDSRVVLSVLVALVALSNLASAVAPNIETVLVARVVIGIGVGGFWALAAGIGPRLVPGARVPLATAIVFGGISAAAVLGVPATAHLGNVIGWRAGSVTIAAVASVVALAVRLLVPALPARPGWRDQESGNLSTAVRRSWLVLLVTALVAIGQFSAFTFVGPILESLSGVAESELPRVLLAYGVAGMAGNFLAGRFVGRNPRRGIQLIATTITVTLFVLLTVDVGPASTTSLMVVWGLAFGGSAVTLQLWLLQVSGRAGQLATSASVSVFNVAIAVGSGVGGVAIDVTGTASSALVVAVVVLLTAALTTILSRPRVMDDDPHTHA